MASSHARVFTRAPPKTGFSMPFHGVSGSATRSAPRTEEIPPHRSEIGLQHQVLTPSHSPPLPGDPTPRHKVPPPPQQSPCASAGLPPSPPRGRASSWGARLRCGPQAPSSETAAESCVGKPPWGGRRNSMRLVMSWSRFWEDAILSGASILLECMKKNQHE